MIGVYCNIFVQSITIHLNLNQDQDVHLLHLRHHMIRHLTLSKKQRKLSVEGEGRES